MTTGRRLLAYALLYKKVLSVALIFLMIAVGAELTGPFIGKKMIDDHILGVENRMSRSMKRQTKPFITREITIYEAID